MDKPLRFYGADGIRGLACLMVLIAHIPGFFFQSIASYFSGTGKYGVWLFFVLSAFLLTSKFKQTGFSAWAVMSYGLGRVLRIVPVFLIVVFIYWMVGFAGIQSLEDLGSAATMSKGFSHLWTIPVEFKFYFVLPFFAAAFIFVRSRLGVVSTAVFGGIVIASHQMIWPFWGTPPNSISTSWYIPSFIFGCYAAVSIDDFKSRVNASGATAMAFVVLVLFLVFSPGGRSLLFGMPLDGWLMDKFIPLSFLWMLFVLSLADGRGFLGRVMQARGLRALGAWSYSIYLIHWLFYQGLSALQGGAFTAVLALIGSIIAGGVMFRLFESPIERFRHSLQQRIAGRNQPAT